MVGPKEQRDGKASGWREALDELERNLVDACRAIGRLRDELDAAERGELPEAPEATEPATDDSIRLVDRPRAVDEPAPTVEDAPRTDESTQEAFARLWDRIENEKLEQGNRAADAPTSLPRGLDSLPQQYLVRAEDKERGVDLVPLHRALLSVAKAEDISLVSFVNRVPVVSVRTEGAIDIDRLRQAATAAMQRPCDVVAEENGRLFLQLGSPEAVAS